MIQPHQVMIKPHHVMTLSIRGVGLSLHDVVL
jgi:hypothetical protein